VFGSAADLAVGLRRRRGRERRGKANENQRDNERERKETFHVRLPQWKGRQG
jgi:hypothetical protein